MSFVLRAGPTSRIALVLASIVAHLGQVQAQVYPNRPVTWIVPFAAGGGHDTFTRLLADKLSERLGQPIVVENRPGGGGIVAAEAVASRPPDGYTLFTADIGANAIAPSLHPHLRYEPIKSFTPISYSVNLQAVMVVPASLGVSTLKEFIALARSRPGELNYASAGIGGYSHVAAALFAKLAGIQMVHVPYRGGAPGATATAAGDVQFFVTSIPSAKALIDAGRIKPLALIATKRSRLLPDVPTTVEAGMKEFSAPSWAGVVGPAGIAPEVVDRLAAEVNRVLQDPEVEARLDSMGFEVVAAAPTAFRSFMADEITKWEAIIRSAKIEAK